MNTNACICSSPYILSSYFLVPEDVEELFHTFFAKLRENVTPEDISAHLFAQSLITSCEKADIDLQTFSPQVRMDKLLAAVHKGIRIDPSNYEKFLEILGKEKKYSTLVKEMRGMVVFTFNHMALLFTIHLVCTIASSTTSYICTRPSGQFIYVR